MHKFKNLYLAACLVASSATSQAQTENNQMAVHWTLNAPAGGLSPTLINPSLVTEAAPISISGLTRTAPNVTLLALTDLPPVEDSSKYVSYRFTTADVGDADIALSQATYSLNDLTYGQQFQVRAALHDLTSNVTYPLGSTVNFTQVRSVVNVGPANRWAAYYFVNGQSWPLRADEILAPQGALPAFMKPVMLAGNHTYELRFYFSQQGNTDGRGMIDDVGIVMKTIAVQAYADGVYRLAALSGGTTTEKVQANDSINLLPLQEDTYTLSQVDADPGLTLNPDGTISATPGQPGVKTLTYQLCPKYDSEVVADFRSNACKTAVATVELDGPAFPPSVSISCAPNILTDSDNQQAICTIKADTVVSSDLNISLAPLPSSARFAGSCTNLSSISIAAGQDAATCTINAVANTTPGDGNVTAVMTIADPALTSPPIYTVSIRSSSVDIQNDDGVTPSVAKPVPTLAEWAIIALTLLLGAFGATQIRSRRN